MRLIRGVGLAALLLGGIAPHASGQASNSGALDLTLPIGARGTALGGAMVAESGGESVWWNPAGLARVTRAEFGIDHFSTFLIESGDAVSLLLAAGPVGTFAISARLFNYGNTPVTSGTGDEIGTSSLRSSTLGASFGTTFGDRVTGGVSFRLYQIANPCTGACGTAVTGSSTDAAVDFGMQYRASPASPVTIGVSVANLGPKLQVHDQPQADQLPSQFHLGASYTPTNPGWDPAILLRFSGEFVRPLLNSNGTSTTELRAGAEVGYKSGQTTLFARGGLVHLSVASDASGPSVGFGLQNNRVRLDVARVIETFSTELGKPPTYISIRVGL